MSYLTPIFLIVTLAIGIFFGWRAAAIFALGWLTAKFLL